MSLLTFVLTNSTFRNPGSIPKGMDNKQNQRHEIKTAKWPHGLNESNLAYFNLKSAILKKFDLIFLIFKMFAWISCSLTSQSLGGRNTQGPSFLWSFLSGDYLALIPRYRLIISIYINGNFRRKRWHICSLTVGSCAEPAGQSDTCAAAGWRMQRLGRGIIQRQLQKNTDRQARVTSLVSMATYLLFTTLSSLNIEKGCPSVWEEPWGTKTDKGSILNHFSLDYTQLIWYSNKKCATHTHTHTL